MGRRTLVTAIGGATALAATALALGSGMASADPLAGKTYSEASSAIGEAGGTPVVSNVVGARVSRDDCIVTSWHKDPVDNSKYLVALNCNATVAAPGVAGNSAASPEGRAEVQHQAAIKWRSQNPEWCAQAMAQHPEWGELDGCDYSAE